MIYIAEVWFERNDDADFQICQVEADNIFEASKTIKKAIRIAKRKVHYINHRVIGLDRNSKIIANSDSPEVIQDLREREGKIYKILEIEIPSETKKFIELLDCKS